MFSLLQILFLNKDDLFVKKVQTSDIKNFFPVRSLLCFYHYREVEFNSLKDFDGASNDPKAGREYFKRRFGRLAAKAGRSKEREIYIQ